MKSNKMHLVPQIVIDCAEGLSTSKNINTKTAYEMRLEAIRDYCDDVLKNSRQVVGEPTRGFKFDTKRNRK